MSHLNLSAEQLASTREKVEHALEAIGDSPVPPGVYEALRASQEFINSLDDADSKLNAHDGFIDWTFEDESNTGQLREVQARIYYDWIDYNSPDQETPEFGGYGQVADVEVLGVQYYADNGKLIDQGQLDEETARQLVEEFLPSIQDACTEAGSQVGAGRAHPLRASGGESSSVFRMAPSNRRRRPSSTRKFG